MEKIQQLKIEINKINQERERERELCIIAIPTPRLNIVKPGPVIIHSRQPLVP